MKLKLFIAVAFLSAGYSTAALACKDCGGGGDGGGDGGGNSSFPTIYEYCYRELTVLAACEKKYGACYDLYQRWLDCSFEYNEMIHGR